MRLLLLLFLALAVATRGAEPFLKPNDVVALVGGEDAVVASELGYLETMLHRALPEHHLKIRSLAWEGDTVFEQRRDLNYPPLEAQLDKIGATVVIAQIGLMERLAPDRTVEQFSAACAEFLMKVTADRTRGLIVMPPVWPGTHLHWIPDAKSRERFRARWVAFDKALDDTVVRIGPKGRAQLWFMPAQFDLGDDKHLSADGIHLLPKAQFARAAQIADLALPRPGHFEDFTGPGAFKKTGFEGREEQLRQLVVEKNRLWFHYTRPQNWAFLAGDRTNQPSSRDHIDKNKRWFPEEMEKFIPLIEAKEKEIWELATKLKANRP
jgi:hypothetical protein